MLAKRSFRKTSLFTVLVKGFPDMSKQIIGPIFYIFDTAVRRRLSVEISSSLIISPPVWGMLSSNFNFNKLGYRGGSSFRVHYQDDLRTDCIAALAISTNHDSRYFCTQ